MQQRVKRGALRRALSVLLAALIVGLVFTAGYFTCYLTLDPAVRTLQWVKNIVKKKYYEEFSAEQIQAATLDSLFYGQNKLLDDYSAYYTAEAYKERQNQQAGNQLGIGISFLSAESGADYTLIYSVSGNSPAEESGLKRGMYFRGYGADGENVTYSGYTAAFSSFLAGMPEGEPFIILASDTADGETTEYEVYRTQYVQNYVFYSDSEASFRYTGKKADELTSGRSDYDFLPEDTAVVRLDSFAGDAAAQFAGMLSVFKERGKSRLLLDLRNNGGGRMDILSDIASYLCKEAGTRGFSVAKAVYRNGKETAFTSTGNHYEEYLAGAEVGILVNENTASASEALAGAMIDYGTMEYSDVFVAEVDGTARSYGKGIMQTTYENWFTGEAVKLTTATIRWPLSDNCIHGKGLTPADGATAIVGKSYVDLSDGMLRAVVEWLAG